MSSWACQSGSWTASNCVTTSGATFSQSLTVNLYSVVDNTIPPQSGGSLGTIKQTFNIPYRPTSTPSKCGGDAGRWYSTKDKTCYHGFAVPISVDFSGQKIAIPANGKLIVTVAFNTTSAGPIPIGVTACNATSAGCPYDSLNIGTESDGGFPERVGNWLTAEEGKKLLGAETAYTLRSRRNRALLSLLIGCGLRRAEVTTLRLGSSASGRPFDHR
jgi:hypothetical protein